MPLTARRTRPRTAPRAESHPAPRDETRIGGRTHAAARALSLAAACAFAALAALLALAGPAAAHADLVSSSPSDRAVIDTEPQQVTLVFSEAVTLRLSSATVIGPDGRRVDNGPLRTVGSGDERVTVPLAADQHRGTYVLTWRVTTADDGHTTSGALTFSVGAPSLPASAPAGSAAGRPGGSNHVTDAVLDIAVWLGFAGLALLVGFAAVRLYCLPPDPARTGADGHEADDGDADAAGDDEAADGDGQPGTHPAQGTAEDPAPVAGPRPYAGTATSPYPSPAPGARTGDLVALDSTVTHVSSADPRTGIGTSTSTSTGTSTDGEQTTAGPETGIGTHTPRPLGALRWPGALGWSVLLAGTVLQLLLYGPATQGSSVTQALDRSLLSASLSTHVGHTLVARIMLLALVAIVGEAILRHRAAGTVAAGALTLLLALTWSETSHAPSGSHAALAVLVTTLHVASMAVWAGGVATLAVLLARGSQAGAAVNAAAARFSRLALTAVCVLAATGLYQAYREVGSLSALTGTHYGRLLLTKAGEFALVLAIATVTRTRLHRRREQATSWTLRRSVMLELAGVTGVLIVTVMLIGTAPARTGTTGAPAPATTPVTTFTSAATPPPLAVPPAAHPR